MLDTCVLVSAFRNRDGASARLLELVLEGRLKPLISVPLVLEYESVLTRREQLQRSSLSEAEAVRIVKAFCLVGEQVNLRFRIRPQVLDPGDEFVLETAFHGNADAIVTFNRRHFRVAAPRFGFEVISPREALGRIDRL